MVKAIVTDIEGTTTSIAFVHTTLFPYARTRLRAFLREQAGNPVVAAQLQEVARIEGRVLSNEESAAVLERWIDEDRKLTPLKLLQGMIWQQGYAAGDLQGHVYPDAPVYLRRWHADGKTLYVYSSGSVEAQQLIFGHSIAGDLRPLFTGYFDTRIGGKKEAASYERIAAEVGVPAGDILFLSDVGEELDAAAAAGMKTWQLLRDGQARPSPAHPQARDFSEVRI